MAKEKVLITVKTYPALSKTYTELVCTAGIKEDGSWIRIYPSPFRFLEKSQQYEKYQWIELDLEKNPKDPRPESYRPKNIDDIKAGNSIKAEGSWEARKEIIFGKNKVYTNLDEIISAAKNNEYSLVIFKPTEVTDFTYEKVDSEWELSKKQAVEESLKQGSLFQESTSEDFKLMPKLPYKFKYHFKDDSGKESKMMIEDWEIGQLYWNCRKKYGEIEAVEKVKEKYFNEFVEKCDLYFFLGTVFESHVRKFRNPYVIIGTFHPRKTNQESLF
jgi:hypothetical protein